MYLRDFAEIRGVKPDTVASYIRNHPEIAELTSMEGKFMVLSDEAVDILDKKYPLPKPVQVVQDTESLKTLSEAQQTIILMQQKMLEMAAENKKLALQAEKVLMLEAAELEKVEKIGKLEADIDSRNEIITEKEKQLYDEQQAHYNTVAELAEAQKQLSDAQQELERLKNRSFFQRLFNK